MFGLYKRKSAQKRDIYFKSKGWEEPPVSLEERRTLAKKFYDQGDYETAIMLYDEIEDYDDSGFLNLMGQMFLDENSEYFDQSQATMYFRRSFLRAQTDDLKEEGAQNFISSYIKEYRITPDQVHKIFVDPHIRQSVAFLGENNIEARALQFGESVNRMFFYVASAYGGDGDLADNHEHAVGLYQAYLEAEDQGYLKETYQNLAIRYALGLGCIPDADKALNILKTAEIYFTDTTINEVLVSCLTRYVERSSNHIYAQTTNAIIEKIQMNGHPWAVIPFLEDPKNYDVSAIADVSFLTAFLANAENWRFAEKWQGVAHSAARKSSTHAYMNFDFVFPTRLGAVNRVNPQIREIEGNDFILPSKRIKLHEYFKSHGLGIPPKDQEERLQKSIKFGNQVPPNYEAAMLMFDPDIDQDHSRWLLTMGVIHDAHINNEKYFDAEKAFDYFIRSSKLGNTAASYNIALKYLSGHENEIDLDESLKWFEKAKEQGDIPAATKIADIRLLQKSFETTHAETYPDEEIVQLYLEGAEKGDLRSWNKYARCQLNGTGVTKSEESAISNWLKILEKTPQKHEEPLYASLALQMAIRSFLGIGLDRNTSQALQYLSKILDQSNHANIRYYLQEWKTLLISYIHAESSLQNNDLSLIQRLYRNPDYIQTAIQEIDNGSIQVSDRLVNYISCAKWLSAAENWSSQYDWNDLAEAAQARQLRFTFQQAVSSTKDGGPRYNVLDERGLPILGVLLKPSENEREELAQRQRTGSYVPQPGLISLRRISADAQGFKYYGAYSEDLPAMLTEEDRKISEILVFGDTEKGPLFPSLSLEKQNNDQLGKGAKGSGYDKVFVYKIFNPQWLAYTDFGRTLWITDYLIGQWCWSPEKFKIGHPKDCSSPDQHFTAMNLIRDLRLTGGRDGGASSARVMIQPKSNYILPEAPKDGEVVCRQDAASVDIKQMTMKVYGAYVSNDGNVENRSLFEEDANFQQGRTVKKLTDRYNEIMQLDPRFERAQQLMALFYGHLRLLQVGYRPSSKLQEDLTSKLKAMESLGREKSEKLLVRRAFGLRPY